MSETKRLTPVGGWKRMMCIQVKFLWGTCYTPDGPIDVGSKECDNCRYNYDHDYINKEE